MKAMWNCDAYHLAFGAWLKERLKEKGKSYTDFAKDIFPKDSAKGNPADDLKARCRDHGPMIRWGLNEICRIANHELFREAPSYLLAQVEHYYRIHQHELEKKLASAAAREAEEETPQSTPTATVT